MKRFDPLDARFLRLGRLNPDEPSFTLWWSGSGFRTRLECRRLEVEVDCPDNEQACWLAVIVDDAPVARFPMRPGAHRYAILEGMEWGIAHEVSVIRDTQPHDSDGGVPVLTAVWTDGVPQRPAEKPRLIEFIGDSLTVGEGMMGSKDAMEWRMTWISTTHAFPGLVCASLNAERRLVALGGWGVWRAWDGDPANNMARIYRQLCGVVPGGNACYNFEAQRPADAVVINLGTNDQSAVERLLPEDQPAAREAITLAAEALMALVRETAPEALIVWAYGLCGTALTEPIIRAVEARRLAGDERVRFLPLTDCAGDFGSRQHPGRASHARAAREITALLEAEGV